MGPLLTPWNIAIWTSWLAGFCIREALAVWWKGCPWDTFSRFVWDLQVKFEFATVGVVFLVAILGSHLIRFRGVQEGDRLPVKEQLRRRRVVHAHRLIAREVAR